MVCIGTGVEASCGLEMVETMGFTLYICTLPGQVTPECLGPGKMDLSLRIHGGPGAILSSKDEPVLIDSLPSYFELKGALEISGLQYKFSFNRDSLHARSNHGGPPQNIRSWVRFAVACSHVRNKLSILSTPEVEEIVEVIIFLSLDHQLHGLTVLLYECIQSLISCFIEKEWKNICNKLAKSLACRVPRDLNYLRAVECISGYDTLRKQLRSSVAYQILLVCFDIKAIGIEAIGLVVKLIREAASNCVAVDLSAKVISLSAYMHYVHACGFDNLQCFSILVGKV
ncbi:hypothetical protein F2P56_030032 [Juglans regia]|uniref:Uncharacterized protein n=1 Tax=Juglans regia TaxID=51240 RepID=A0A833WX95_JUGRE|nr:hypothetical protein F2P56_030032 [Juglans regia]